MLRRSPIEGGRQILPAVRTATTGGTVHYCLGLKKMFKSLCK